MKASLSLIAALIVSFQVNAATPCDAVVIAEAKSAINKQGSGYVGEKVDRVGQSKSLYKVDGGIYKGPYEIYVQMEPLTCEAKAVLLVPIE